MEQGSADEWRIWETMSPDDSLLRLVVEDAAGRVAAMADVSDGGAFRSSRWRAERRGFGRACGPSQRHRERAACGDRRRGGPTQGAAIPRRPSDAHRDAMEWATKRGFREIGRRIEAYVELGSFDPGAFGASRRRGPAIGHHVSDDRGDPSPGVTLTAESASSASSMRRSDRCGRTFRGPHRLRTGPSSASARWPSRAGR